MDEYETADAVQAAHEESHDASGFDPYQFIDALTAQGYRVMTRNA